MTSTNLMHSPGHIDPLTIPRPGVVDGITPREDGRIDLMGLARQRIADLFVEAGLDAKAAKLRSRQVFHWIYHRGVTEFEAMTDIAKTMRPWLAERFVIGRPEVVEAQHSTDGTRKWLLRTDDGHDFEMVFIPDADRGTLCVSSQVGCTLNCRFCHTGTMRLVRNLTPGEIVGQVMLARDALGEWPKGSMAGFTDDEDDLDDDEGGGGSYSSDGRLLTNIVMMGMGEPLYNFDNVRDALKLVMDGDGLGLSRRRITLSTSGVVPLIARAGEEIGVNLAVSLHAVTKQVRDEIVPINRKYGIEELLEACAAYPQRIERAAHHLRICHAQGQERQRRGCARTGAPDQEVQAVRQGQPDPVQSVARCALRMLRAGPHPPAFQRLSSKPGSAPRCAPRAGATSMPPAASSRPRPKRRAARNWNGCGPKSRMLWVRRKVTLAFVILPGPERAPC